MKTRTSNNTRLLLIALVPMIGIQSLPAGAEPRGSVTHVYKDGKNRDFVLKYGPAANFSGAGRNPLPRVGKAPRQDPPCVIDGSERNPKICMALQAQAERKEAEAALAAQLQQRMEADALGAEARARKGNQGRKRYRRPSSKAFSD